MTRIPIAALTIERSHLDAETVRRYAAQSAVPPVVVFKTEEGFVVADGHHRIAAAVDRGDSLIDADVRDGSRADALAFALDLAAARGVDREAALAAIMRRASDPAG